MGQAQTSLADNPEEPYNQVDPSNGLEHYKVVIVGAGVAGLSCANELVQTGTIALKDILILEATEKIGGRCRTVQLGSQRFDTGASWVHGTEDNELLDAASQSGIILGPDSREVPDLYMAFAEYESSTFSNIRCVRYPTTLLNWMESFLEAEILERLMHLSFIVDEVKYLRKKLVRFALAIDPGIIDLQPDIARQILSSVFEEKTISQSEEHDESTDEESELKDPDESEHPYFNGSIESPFRAPFRVLPITFQSIHHPARYAARRRIVLNPALFAPAAVMYHRRLLAKRHTTSNISPAPVDPTSSPMNGPDSGLRGLGTEERLELERTCRADLLAELVDEALAEGTELFSGDLEQLVFGIDSPIWGGPEGQDPGVKRIVQWLIELVHKHDSAVKEVFNQRAEQFILNERKNVRVLTAGTSSSLNSALPDLTPERLAAEIESLYQRIETLCLMEAGINENPMEKGSFFNYFIAEEWTSEGGNRYVCNGYDRLPQKLESSARLRSRVRLSSPVTHVIAPQSCVPAGDEAGKEGATSWHYRQPQPLSIGTRAPVETAIRVRVAPAGFDAKSAYEVCADTLVLALPLAVVKQNGVEFEPALPKDKRAAIARLGTGILEKVLLRFKSQFWSKKARWLGNACGKARCFGWFFNMAWFPTTQEPVLCAFITTDFAMDMLALPDEQVFACALAELQKAYPAVDVAAQFVEGHFSRWTSHPHFRGAWSFAAKDSRYKWIFHIK
jgi:hypothetical protein